MWSGTATAGAEAITRRRRPSGRSLLIADPLRVDRGRSAAAPGKPSLESGIGSRAVRRQLRPIGFLKSRSGCHARFWFQHSVSHATPSPSRSSFRPHEQLCRYHCASSHELI
ncbi:MAG: hypothetical protein EOS71_27930 [Mesorhizobium sp.]|nr:MAG: hypothetical protein EOS71_27930 [Mesorhizobium sp.]